MVRLACMIACAVFLSVSALAQGSQLEKARFLLKVGYAEPALAILETLPETQAVLQGRAQAHIMIASQIPPAGRCDHLRRATDLASQSSAQGLVEFSRRRFREEGCQMTQPGS
jgi:thioredoxin-like negative regulator of GroEL